MKTTRALNVPGLTITEDFLTEEQEDFLIEKIDFEMNRERTPILRYGWGYNPADTWVQDIPDWLKYPKHQTFSGEECPFDSISVHHYHAGRGIPPHIDSLAFGPEIYVLSLLGDSFLLMERGGAQEAFSIPRRSLYVMAGEARELWEHAIEPVKSQRYSIVYRTKLTKPV